MKRYKLSSIRWDTDGEQIDLPKTMEVEAEDDDGAVDAASDQQGWCILGCEIEEIP